MIVTPPSRAEAAGHVADMYEADVHSDGLVFGHTQAMAINPEAHQAFEALIAAIVPSIGLRTYELVTLGAARGIPSPHCLLAHGRKALQVDALDEDQLEELGRGDLSAFTAADAAVLRFAERVSTDPVGMSDADSRSLRENGFTDRQIVDIALAAAARNFFSRALQALDVPVDDVPGLSPRVVEALVGVSAS